LPIFFVVWRGSHRFFENMARDTAKLKTLLGPSIEALGYELWGLIYIPHRNRGVLRIYIDSDQGINVGDCEKVSRQVSAVLDVEDPLMGGYNLEVSSPGLNRPLFTPEQFKRYIGSTVQVQAHTMVDKRRHFAGILESVTEQGVVIKIEDKEFVLVWSNIARANLLPKI